MYETKGTVSVTFLIFTDLTLMFDQPAYTVDEREMVDVVVLLCGNITDDVVVTFTTNHGTAGTAWLFLNDTYLYTFHISYQFGCEFYSGHVYHC